MYNSSRSQSTPHSQDALPLKSNPNTFQGVAIIPVPLTANETRAGVFSGPFYGFQVIEVSSLSPETANVRLKCGRIRGGSVVDSQSIRAALGAGIAQYGYGAPEEDAPFDRLDIAWPVGVTGSLVVLIHLRPPTLPFLMAATLLDRSGSPISTSNPLAVEAVASAIAPLTMGPAVGVVVGAGDTLVLAANAARRALWVGITGVVVGQASFTFDGSAAVLNQGLTLSAAAGGWIVAPPPIFIAPSPRITSAVRAIGSGAGIKVWAQEAT